MKLNQLHNGDMFTVQGICDNKTLTPLTFVMQSEERLSDKKVCIGGFDRHYWLSPETEVNLVKKPILMRNFNYTKE